MKQLIFISFCLCTIPLTSCEKKVYVQNDSNSVNRSDKTVTPEKAHSDLPQNIVNFLKSHYSESQIANYEIENLPLAGKTYEVKMLNGAKLKFNKDGILEEINDPQGLSNSLIPNEIKTYLDKNYKTYKVISLDYEKDRTKVELLNGLDLEFDKEGNFLRLDP